MSEPHAQRFDGIPEDGNASPGFIVQFRHLQLTEGRYVFEDIHGVMGESGFVLSIHPFGLLSFSLSLPSFFFLSFLFVTRPLALRHHKRRPTVS